jgi:MscS family membrane protein
MRPEDIIIPNLTFGNVATIVVVFFLVWLALRYVHRIFTHFSRIQPRMRFLVMMLEPALRIVFWFGALIFAVQVLAPSQNAFVAALGSAAIAIGLGAQDLIKNIIGGMVVVADRPYQTGDRLRLGGAYGEVQQIGLRSTKIMTPGDTLVTVPNSEILTGVAHNSNAGVPECMVDTELYLPAGADPTLVLQIGQEVAATSPYTHIGRRRFVRLEDGFNQEFYIKLIVRAYVYDHRYEPDMQNDITRRCKMEFLKRGILAAPKQ